ncbi:ThuA domain-containing protein [Rubritalea tangerina]|uniref:ThuA domain-containing protein n=1 Tax=Rubritalea tangerina TaxID=430798 RepID=A0ABW4ZCR6_9BACT
MKMKSLPLAMALAGLGLFSLLCASQNKEKGNVAPEKLERVAAALPQKAAEPKKKRKLLIYTETKGYRHQSIDIGKVAFEAMGKESGAYESVVSNDLGNFEAEAIQEFDAICFLNTTLEVFRPHPVKFKLLNKEEKDKALEKERRLQQNLLNYVKNGGGFIGIHAASDTFYQWAEFGEMLGGYFDGHPWNARTDVSIVLAKGAEGNPIVTSMKDGEALNFKEEIYQLKDPYDSSKLDMLLRLDTENSDMKVRGIKRTDNDFGVSWTKSYGKGRVFYCSLGHNEHIYWNPKVLSIYLNGIQWAMGDL